MDGPGAARPAHQARDQPPARLAATAGPVTARVHRLLDPPRPGRHARYGLALAAVTLLLACLPVLATAIAGHLVSPA